MQVRSLKWPTGRRSSAFLQFWLPNQMKCFVLTAVGYSSVRVEPLILANSIEQRSLETKRPSINQEDPSILCNPKVHYCVHKRPLLFPVLSYINLVHVNIIVPFMARSSKWFPLGLTTNTMHIFLLYPMHVTFPANFISLR